MKRKHQVGRSVGAARGKLAIRLLPSEDDDDLVVLPARENMESMRKLGGLSVI